MKFLTLSLALFAITTGAVFASISPSKDLALLLDETLKQADNIVGGGEKSLVEVRRTSPHLALITEHLVRSVKDTKLRMQVALVEHKVTIDFAQVHVMQEQLLRLQNEMLTQDSLVYRTVSDLHNITVDPKALAPLVEAIKLEAKLSEEKFRSTADHSLLAFEVKALDELSRVVANNNNQKDSSVVKQLYEQVYLHQRTVRDLTAKANWRVNQPEV